MPNRIIDVYIEQTQFCLREKSVLPHIFIKLVILYS